MTQNYERELAQFLEEALVMKGFVHPNILGLYGVVIQEFAPYVVLEYMDKGDLRSYVSKVDKVSKHYILLVHILNCSGGSTMITVYLSVVLLAYCSPV